MDVTVLMATRNRAGMLERTLAALERQELPASLRWELVVVDNGSSDGTPSVLEAFENRLPLFPMREDRPGKNRALNRGLEVVRGEFLVFTDDDILVGRRWLSELWNASRRWPGDVIFGGPIVPLYPEGTPVWLREHPFVITAFCAFSQDGPEGPMHGRRLPFGGNFGVRSSALGGHRFSEGLGPQGRNYIMGGETDLLRRLQNAGYRAIYVPEASVQHVIRPDQLRYRWLMRRAFLAGRGDAVDQPDLTSTRLFGTPRHLWRAGFRRGVAHGAGFVRGSAARFTTGIEFFRTAGRLHQHRKGVGGPAPSSSHSPDRAFADEPS